MHCFMCPLRLCVCLIVGFLCLFITWMHCCCVFFSTDNLRLLDCTVGKHGHPCLGDQHEDEEVLGVMIGYSSQRVIQWQRLQLSWRLWWCSAGTSCPDQGEDVLLCRCCAQGKKGSRRHMADFNDTLKLQRTISPHCDRLLCADTWNTPNCTWQGMPGPPQCTTLVTKHHTGGQGQRRLATFVTQLCLRRTGRQAGEAGWEGRKAGHSGVAGWDWWQAGSGSRWGCWWGEIAGGVAGEEWIFKVRIFWSEHS